GRRVSDKEYWLALPVGVKNAGKRNPIRLGFCWTTCDGVWLEHCSLHCLDPAGPVSMVGSHADRQANQQRYQQCGCHDPRHPPTLKFLKVSNWRFDKVIRSNRWQE